MGRRHFTQSEIEQIRELLAEKVHADRIVRKSIRQKIRNLEFNISDFKRPAQGFGPDDLDKLIESGQITVTDARVDPEVWWVNQGTSYRVQSAGGYLWAPQVTKRGYSVDHHTDMRKLKVDDVVVSYSNSAIRALLRITSETRDAERPAEMPKGDWVSEGMQAEAEYYYLDEPVRLKEIPEGTRVPESGPFSEDGRVKQGYLYSADAGFARQLRERFNDRWPAGSPWADYDALARNAIHLLFKWSADKEPRTVYLHKDVAESKGSVWWGKFGNRERAALSDDNIEKVRTQLRYDIPTSIYIYRSGETWVTDLEEITADPDDV